MKPKALLVALALLVSMAGCGSNTEPVDQPTITVSVGASEGAGGSGLPCQDDQASITCETQPVPAAAANEAFGNSQNYTVNDYLVYTILDLDVMWTKWFLDNGFREPQVGYVIISGGDSFSSACDLLIDSNHPNAYYCPNDQVTDANGVVYQGAILLPENTFANMWNGNIFGFSSASVGDFAAAIIVAHEFGHNVADELRLQWNEAYPNQVTNAPTGKYNELLADCFAGVWMNSAYYKNYLIDTDYQEAVGALQAIGDQGVAANPHGTPEERVVAVTAGYNSGNPMDCVAAYWQ